MTLDIPKRKVGRPKKIKEEPDANKVIDIWFGPEPTGKESEDWQIDFALKVLAGLFLFFSILYLIRRI